MKKYVINIGKISIIAIIMLLFGIFISINGLIIRINLKNIQNTYEPTSIKKGHFIETDIYVTDFLGSMLPTSLGKRFFPLVGENPVTNEMRYVVRLNEEKNYYITIIVTSEYRKEIENLLKTNGNSHHFIGKMVKLDTELPYDNIAYYIGSDDKNTINKIVSPKYAIIIIDIEKQEEILKNGMRLMLVAIFLFLISSIEKR